MSFESILENPEGLKEAELYDRLPGGRVRCRLCGPWRGPSPHRVWRWCGNE